MFLNISLKSKGKWIVIVAIILILILIISIFLMLNLIDKTANGEKINDKLDLTFTNYYIQADMTVVSNKNTHTYNVKEWHKEGIITKLEYLDYMKNTVTIILENNACSISNSGNTAKLVINNMYENRNISSLSTFGYLYNLDCKSCICEKTQHIKEEEDIVKINFNEGCSCQCNSISEELKISSLELVLINGIPKNYTVYDKNKKEYICIVYNVYEKNIEI